VTVTLPIIIARSPYREHFQIAALIHSHFRQLSFLETRISAWTRTLDSIIAERTPLRTLLYLTFVFSTRMIEDISIEKVFDLSYGAKALKARTNNIFLCNAVNHWTGRAAPAYPPTFGEAAPNCPPAFGGDVPDSPPAFGGDVPDCPPAFGGAAPDCPPAFGAAVPVVGPLGIPFANASNISGGMRLSVVPLNQAMIWSRAVSIALPMAS
jgi:hypothetical protein